MVAACELQGLLVQYGRDENSDVTWGSTAKRTIVEPMPWASKNTPMIFRI
jgi:hypothetical protein